MPTHTHTSTHDCNGGNNDNSNRRYIEVKMSEKAYSDRMEEEKESERSKNVNEQTVIRLQ